MYAFIQPHYQTCYTNTLRSFTTTNPHTTEYFAAVATGDENVGGYTLTIPMHSKTLTFTLCPHTHTHTLMKSVDFKEDWSCRVLESCSWKPWKVGKTSGLDHILGCVLIRHGLWHV